MTRARAALVVAMVVGIAVLSGAPRLTAATPRPASATMPTAWRVRVGPHGTVATPVVSRGAAFTSDHNLITAVELADGARRWQTSHNEELLGADVLGEPSLVGGRIETPWFQVRSEGVITSYPRTGAYAQSHEAFGRLGHVAIDHGTQATLESGFIPGLWAAVLEYPGPHPGWIYSGSTGGPAPFSDPVFVGHHIWVGVHDALGRFDPGTCVPAPPGVPYCMPSATAPLDGNIVGIAAGPRHTLVATTDTGVVQVFDGTSGNELWRATPGGTLTAPTVAGDVIVVGDSAGRVLAFPASGCGAATCARLWKGDAGAAVSRPPAFSAGTVYVGTASGSVVGFAVGGCAAAAVCPPVAIGSAKHASAVTGGPVVASGLVIVGTADGHLTAFRVQ